MKLIILIGIILSVLVCSIAQGSESAFLGAVGFGVDTRAGTDGKVIRVTNLNSEGPGSLREALEAKCPRLVVFEVGGVIDLAKKPLVISEPFLTVAGQTAPSPGITIIRGKVSVETHDVLIQHIRVRPGDAGEAKGSGWDVDALGTDAAYNVVIDHCSFTWATDENLSASGPRLDGPDATSRRITLSNCIVAESLNDSTHSKGPHSKGSLIHDNCRDIAVIGNLYAHNYDRNPFFKAHTTGVIVNNIIYNPGSAAILLRYSLNEWKEASYKPENARVSVVGNIMIHGVDTWAGLPLVKGEFGSAYLEDNLAFDLSGKPVKTAEDSIVVLKEKPVWPVGMKPVPAAKLEEYIVKNVGARPWDRDAVDRRIVSGFQQRKGRIINSQEEVGGYPKHSTVRRALDVPDTGRREWLKGFEK